MHEKYAKYKIICKYARKICKYGYCSCILTHFSCIFAYLYLSRVRVRVFAYFSCTLTCAHLHIFFLAFAYFSCIYAYARSTCEYAQKKKYVNMQKFKQNMRVFKYKKDTGKFARSSEQMYTETIDAFAHFSSLVFFFYINIRSSIIIFIHYLVS